MDENSCTYKESYDFENHWNKAYQKTPTTNLGWYEENPVPSLNLIDECNLSKDALIFNAGAGASTLIKELIERGFSNIIVNDIASEALNELKTNLSKHTDSNLKYIVDDLTSPAKLLELKEIDLWHDRAVLHFFTTQQQQDTYFNLLKKVVKIGGFVILAEFNLEGAKKCSGLNVFNYNEKMLQERLGANFKLLKFFNYTYTQPSGNTREYIYTLFQKKA